MHDDSSAPVQRGPGVRFWAGLVALNLVLTGGLAVGGWLFLNSRWERRLADVEQSYQGRVHELEQLAQVNDKDPDGGSTESVPDSGPSSDSEEGPQTDIGLASVTMPQAGPALQPVPVNPTPPTVPAEPAPSQPRSLAEIIESVNDGVVLITMHDALGQDTGQGSGFVIETSGLVATNYHVIASGVSATVQLRDGREVEVVGVRAHDPDNDLVILEIDEAADRLEAFELQVEGEPAQGSKLIAIGHPKGFQFTATDGIVSAVRHSEDMPKEYQEVLGGSDDTLWVQTSAAISPGSSGGPLLDRNGRVVAINTWIAAGQNLGFAVHVQHLHALMDHMNEEAEALPLPGLGLFTRPEVVTAISAYQRELQHYMLASRQQQSEAARVEVLVQNNPRPTHARKLVEMARDTEDSMIAVEALDAACQLIAQDASESAEVVLTDILSLVQSRYVDHPRMAHLALSIGARATDPVRDLLRTLIEQSPHHDVRGAARLALAATLSEGNLADRYSVDRLQLYEAISEQFADVRLRGERLGDVVEEDLFAVTHLSRGRPALEIEGQDIDGETFRLSDFRGKVTLIDFSADWCPHCRNMYPVHKELVEKYQDRPFALVAVSADPEATLRRLVDNGTITWPTWFDGPPDAQQGPDGKITQEWHVTSYPTMLIVDQHGRIARHIPGAIPKEQLQEEIEWFLGSTEFEFEEHLIGPEAEWSYKAASADQTHEWRDLDFDDADWQSGAAPLGFGWGDEATILKSSGSITRLFRRRFSIEDTSTVSDLLISLQADDGCAVFINGQPVARTRLSDDAGPTTLAAEAAPADGRHSVWTSVNPDVLLDGENVVAVEVHQEHAASADLWFKLELVPNALPDLKAKLAEGQSSVKQFILSRLPHLGESAKDCIGQVRGLFDNEESIALRTSALNTLLALSPADTKSLSLPPAKGPTEMQSRLARGNYLALRAWEIVQSDRYSSQDHQRLRSYIAMARRLNPQFPQLNVIQAMNHNHLGEYDQVAAALGQGSLLKFSYDPLETACRAIMECKTGNTKAARRSLDQVRRAVKDSQWAWNGDVRKLARMAERLLEAQSSDTDSESEPADPE